LIGLERVLADDENGPLNEIGVNVIRSFVGRGIRVWGARTIAPLAQTQWRYVNVRRLMLFIEESLQEGTIGSVFEPNNEALWETLKRTVSGFLNRVWRSGALVGNVPEEEFRVRIDRELNPPEVRALGQLVIEVRVAPTTPAEFIVFRIIQQPGEPIIEE
jgi:phage tail sheath protein FI